MAFTVKTIVKLFMLFLYFQISINFLVEFIPDALPTFSETNQDYLDFVKEKTNAQIDSTSQGRSLLDNFQKSLETENYFNDSIIDTFLGTLQVIGSILKFLFQLALLILFTPTVIIEILLYNFIGVSSLLYGISIVINIFMYMTLFYIAFRARIK